MSADWSAAMRRWLVVFGFLGSLAWCQQDELDGQGLTLAEASEIIDRNKAFWESQPDEQFYGKSAKFWASATVNGEKTTTVNGVLGGFGDLSEGDIAASSKLIQEVRKMRPLWGNATALDCGAGVGRITAHLLTNFHQRVDLAEADGKLVAAAEEYVPKHASHPERFGRRFNEAMQDLKPEPGAYDTIWIQWSAIFLTDEHLIAFLKRAAKGLKPHGLIVLKENTLAADSEMDLELDTRDSSATRSHRAWRAAIRMAGLGIVKYDPEPSLGKDGQPNWPSNMQPVRTYVLQPLPAEQVLPKEPLLSKAFLAPIREHAEEIEAAIVREFAAVKAAYG